MATLTYEMTIREKDNFKVSALKAAMINSLQEIGGTVINIDYQPNCVDSDVPGGTEKLSKCVCMVTAPDMPFTSGASIYQILLGDIQEVALERYPYFEIVSIPADKIF